MRRLAVLLVCTAAFADPRSAFDLNEEGISRMRGRRFEAAASLFEQALGMRPDAAEVLEANLATALAAAGEDALAERRAADAISPLQRAVGLRPGRIRFRFLLGRARFEAGDDRLRAVARHDLDWVLERDRDHLDALVLRGHVEYLDRDLAAAVVDFARALALRPGDHAIAERLRKAERELQVESSFVEIPTAFFVVRYSPSIPVERAQEALAVCEEARGRLSALYASYPPRIVVTLYTPQEFREATGVHAWVAGLSDGTIRLTVGPRTDEQALKATIRHELVHHVVRHIAPNAPVWLHEGLAQLEEGRSAADAEARLRRALPLPEGLLSADVLGQADRQRVMLFYDASLAFTRFLNDGQQGAILKLLREIGAGKDEASAFRDAFGDSREALYDRWRATLR